MVILLSLPRMEYTYLSFFRLARVSSRVNDFNNRNKVLTAKPLHKAIGVKNSVKTEFS